jgi:hypothetical protein
MGDFFSWIHDWQELVGAFLGSSLAIIFSGLGFLLARYLEVQDAQREALRKVEINNSYSLQSVFTIRKKIDFFVKRARKFVKELKENTNPTEIVFSSINFEPLGEIHADSAGHNARIKSYYLHNKLLAAHSAITNTNLVLIQFQKDFENVIRMNEMMISLTKETPKPFEQRKAYAENVEIFADVLSEFSENLSDAVETMLQIRVYNSKMRKPFGQGWFLRLKYEGILSEDMNLDMVDRIDVLLADDVKQEIEKAKYRLQRIGSSTPKKDVDE